MLTSTGAILSVFGAGAVLFCLGGFPAGRGEWGMAAGLWFSGATLCAVAVHCHRARLHIVHRYKGVDVFFLRERGRVWSSHIGGYPRGFWARLLGRRFGGHGVRLLTCRQDRMHLEALSLQAFGEKLDSLADTPGAVVISASVLNRADRNPQRLPDRVRVLQARRGQWRYRLIDRRLGRCTSVLGRLIFQWDVRGGWWARAVVPGVVAWRVQDMEPPLTRHGLTLIDGVGSV